MKLPPNVPIQIADPVYAVLAKNIRGARVTRGMTQEQLASAAGLKRATIASIERGRQSIHVHTLLHIANGLSLNLAALLPDLVAHERDSSLGDIVKNYRGRGTKWIQQALHSYRKGH